MLEDSQLGVAGAGESTFTAKRMAKFRGVQLPAARRACACRHTFRMTGHVGGFREQLWCRPTHCLIAQEKLLWCAILCLHTHTHTYLRVYCQHR